MISDYPPSLTSLGTLAALPPELRLQIWKHLPLGLGQHEKNSPSPRLGFLGTSRRVYEEASVRVHNHVILQFHIGPQYESLLRAESNFGGSWTFQNLDDAVRCGFDRIPYAEFQSVQINIEAPDPDDPGQVICLHKKCADLAALLDYAPHDLPDMEINLLESVSAKWSVDGKPQESIGLNCLRYWPNRYQAIGCKAVEQSIEYPRFEPNNTEIVLYAFSRLRSVRSARIRAPEDGHRSEDFVRAIGDVIMQKDPVGTYVDPDDEWSDVVLQQDLDDISLELDLELDRLPGETAELMRLERFSSWYTDKLGTESRYEEECKRLIKACPNIALQHHSMVQLQWRHLALRAYNPRAMVTAPGYPEPRINSFLARLSATNNVKSVDQAIDLGFIRDEWDQDSWYSACYRYNRGIYAFGGGEFWKTIGRTHIVKKILRCYTEKFNQKLRSWGIRDVKIEDLFQQPPLACTCRYSDWRKCTTLSFPECLALESWCWSVSGNYLSEDRTGWVSALLVWKSWMNIWRTFTHGSQSYKLIRSLNDKNGMMRSWQIYYFSIHYSKTKEWREFSKSVGNPNRYLSQKFYGGVKTSNTLRWHLLLLFTCTFPPCMA